MVRVWSVNVSAVNVGVVPIRMVVQRAVDVAAAVMVLVGLRGRRREDRGQGQSCDDDLHRVIFRLDVAPTLDLIQASISSTSQRQELTSTAGLGNPKCS